MPAVLGIDVSSFAIDLVRLDENTQDAHWDRIMLLGDTPFERLQSVQVLMPNTAWYDDIYLAAIETPKTRFMNSAGALFPVYGAVVARLPQSLVVWDVHPKTWRRSLGLGGNAPKEAVRLAVELLAPDFCDSWMAELPQDAFDAYAVAYHARETNARAVEEAISA